MLLRFFGKEREIERREKQAKYNNSVAFMLSSVFPQYPWQRWRFQAGAPEKFWENYKNQHQCVEWLIPKLGVGDWQDWYKVTQKQVQEVGGSSLLSYFKDSVPLLVQTIFPYYRWLPWLFVSNTSQFWKEDRLVKGRGE